MPNPQVGQGVWVEGVKPQPNGVIQHIDWYDKEVIVRFYDSNNEEAYEWEQFDTFNERLNQWQIRGTT